MNFVNIEFRDEDNFMLDSINIPGVPEYCGNTKYFQVINLFSELIDPEKKLIARTNLEITFENLPDIDYAIKTILNLSNIWMDLD